MTHVELKTRYSTPEPDRIAVLAARGDYLDKSLIGDEAEEYALETMEVDGETSSQKMRNFLERAIQRGHWGIFEHAQAVFAIEGVSRDMMAQITRHRHMSFDVQSMRYVNFEDASFDVPPDAKDAVYETKYTLGEQEETVSLSASTLMQEAYDNALRTYQDLLDAGLSKEDARKVLPLGTEVNMTVSANLRSLLHFFDLRVSGATQHDTRELAQQMLDQTRDWAPLTVSEWEEHARNSSLTSP